MKVEKIIESAVVEIISGVGTKSGKPYTGIKVTIGEYTNVFFPTPFEQTYIKAQK